MTELPSGTVTFLFTDIEGSTSLLKQLGERYGDVLAEHDRIMRAAIAEAEAAGAAVARRKGISRPRTVAGAAAGLAIAGAIVAAVVLSNGGSSASAAGIAANSVGLINAHNDKVSRQVDVQKSPSGVAVGAGAVWVTNANDGTVSRIDARTGSVTQTITVGTSPSGIAVGGGSVWVANHDDGTVSRIAPGTNAVVQTIGVGNGPTAVAFGAGSVWVTNADDRTVSRIDADSGRVDVTITTDAVGRGIAVGSGSVWVSDESTRSVVRVDPHTNAVVGTVSVGNGPGGVAVSPDASGEWKAPDLARAKALIAASHTRGEKVVVWTFPFFGKEARYMVSLLRQLGYRARMKELPDIDSYFGTLAKAHPQAGFAGWFGVQIADDVFATLSCTFSPNWAEFCDHGLDAQVEKLSREEAENSVAARRLAARIDRTIVDRAPWVPLFTPRLPDFVSERVGNYQYNVYDAGVLLDQVWVR